MSTTNFFDIMTACESTSGKGAKERIQQQLAMLDETGRKLVEAALNPYRTFGAKKVKVKGSNVAGSVLVPFLSLLDKLENRELTGNAAKDGIESVLSQFSKEEQNWLIRVIMKNLRAGFTENTYNKVFPNAVPVFEIMLADKYDTDELLKKNIKFPVYAEHKLDGQRTIAFHSNNISTVYYARGGRLSEHLNGLFDSEMQLLRDLYGCDIVVDGEVMGEDFTQTINAKKDGNDDAKQALVFHVFNIIPMDEWKAGKVSSKLYAMATERNAMLAALQRVLAPEKSKLVPVEGKVVNSFEEAHAFFSEVIEFAEGLILKNPMAHYEFDRSRSWIKWKPFIDVDLEIYDWYYGTPGTRLEHTVGGIKCRGTDEHGNKIDTNVGSGFSGELRADILTNFASKYCNKMVEIRYQELSLAENATTYSLRFPTFRKMRPDKSAT